MKKPVVSREVCPCCDEMVDMYIESDEDYEFVDGSPLLFSRCRECGNERLDPKRNPSNVEIKEKKKHGTG
jgi:hypothetical protein